MRLRFERSALHDWLVSRGAPAARAIAPVSSRIPIERPEARETAFRLVREGLAYACYCTPTELAAMRTHQESHGRPMRYDRRCLSLYAEHRADYEAAGRKSCVRFRVPEGGRMVLADLLRGEVTIPLDDLEDFVLLDAEGRPGEAIGAVLDHARNGVTHVVRDEDRWLQMSRELLLYDALGWQAPRYAHLRMD